MYVFFVADSISQLLIVLSMRKASIMSFTTCTKAWRNSESLDVMTKNIRWMSQKSNFDEKSWRDVNVFAMSIAHAITRRFWKYLQCFIDQSTVKHKLFISENIKRICWSTSAFAIKMRSSSRFHQLQQLSLLTAFSHRAFHDDKFYFKTTKLKRIHIQQNWIRFDSFAVWF